jgi:nucleoid-associated protein YgaU
MGRETKLLLGFLGLLAGAFVGVLSVKLFVPRPPAGAGPDINADAAFAESHALVEPPAPAPRAWDFAAAPPLVPPAATPPRDPFAAAPASPAVDPPAPTDRYAERSSGRFGGPPRATPAATGFAAPADGSVRRVAWDKPDPPKASAAEPRGPAPDAAPRADQRLPEPPAFGQRPLGVEPAALPAAAPPVPAPPAAAPADPTGYVVRPGDSWWAVAAAAYGDGRLYRALFAWNRRIDPRVALAPGTRLQIPPRPRLAAAWPDLVPPAEPAGR